MRQSVWIAGLCGLALGVAGATLFFLNLSLEISRYVLSGFVTLTMAAFLALLGILWYTSRQRRALGDIPKQVSEFTTYLAALSEHGFLGLDDARKLELTSKLEVIVRYIASILATIRAFGFVFGAATVAVSAAILVATLMQVDRLDSQNLLSEASRRSALINELTAILNEIDEEIDTANISDEALSEANNRRAGQGPGFIVKGFTLSDRLTWRIIALSRSLRPYRFLEGERLGDTAFSPERAQLLISLVAAGVELKEILRGGAFEAAYLRDAELSNVNLRDSKLSFSTLRGANLITSDLSECSCRNVDFQDSVLFNVNFKDANLTGSKFQNARLPHPSFFDGAKMGSIDLQDSIVGQTTWLEDVTSLKNAPSDFAATKWIVEPTSIEWTFNGESAGSGYRIRRSNVK